MPANVCFPVVTIPLAVLLASGRSAALIALYVGTAFEPVSGPARNILASTFFIFRSLFSVGVVLFSVIAESLYVPFIRVAVPLSGPIIVVLFAPPDRIVTAPVAASPTVRLFTILVAAETVRLPLILVAASTARELFIVVAASTVRDFFIVAASCTVRAFEAPPEMVKPGIFQLE